MGLRIRKVMGYGLTDFSSDDFVSDPRVNPEGYFALDEDEANEKFSVEEFLIQAKLICSNDPHYNHIGLHLLIREFEEGLHKGFSFDQVRTWDNEYDDSNVMVFTPISELSKWYRHDDIIDYTDAVSNNEGSLNSVKLLGRPIYPYDGWIDLRNPTELPDRLLVEVANMLRFNSKLLQDIRCYKVEEKFGFDSPQDMLDNVVPMIPDELIQIIRYLKVFKDPNTVYQLRPMIYTHWR